MLFRSIDDPAIIRKNGNQEWHVDGKRHRLDGPAHIDINGHQEWHQNGKRHRIDGPAIIWPDGSEEWYRNGKLHRPDGPALIWKNCSYGWYFQNVNFCTYVEEWIIESGVGPWEDWTDVEKLLFRIKFQ